MQFFANVCSFYFKKLINCTFWKTCWQKQIIIIIFTVKNYSLKAPFLADSSFTALFQNEITSTLRIEKVYFQQATRSFTLQI